MTPAAPPAVCGKRITSDRTGLPITQVTVESFQRKRQTQVLADAREGLVDAFEVVQECVKWPAFVADVLMHEIVAKVAAFWQGGLVVDEFDERLFEFLVAWRGDVGRARVWGFIIEVVGERHAIARGGGQNFVLDVAKEGDEADHLLRRASNPFYPDEARADRPRFGWAGRRPTTQSYSHFGRILVESLSLLWRQHEHHATRPGRPLTRSP